MALVEVKTITDLSRRHPAAGGARLSRAGIGRPYAVGDDPLAGPEPEGGAESGLAYVAIYGDEGRKMMGVFRQGLVSVIAGFALGGSCADVAHAVQAFGARTVVVPAIRAEVEPDAEPTSNWAAFQKQLEEFVARPATEDLAVIQEVRAMGKSAPPPFLMEMGKRIA
ncbi:hypothetical protein LTR94_030387, partial [Friedmanniomyces endolithicus]